MAVSLQVATASVDATRPEVGPHRPPAASTDVEVTVVMTVMVMAVVVMMAMTVMMMTVVMAVMTTMTTLTASRSRGNGSSGQSDRGNSCESDFTKHTCSLHFARRDCLMRS